MAVSKNGGKPKDEKPVLPLIEVIMNLWSKDKVGIDERQWNLGIDYGMSLGQIMTKLGDPPDGTAEWKLRSKNVHSMITGIVARKFKEMALWLGPIKVVKGKPVKYCLGKSAEELRKFYQKSFTRLKNCTKNRVEERGLLIKKRQELPNSSVNQKKILDREIRRRPPSF